MYPHGSAPASSRGRAAWVRQCVGAAPLCSVDCASSRGDAGARGPAGRGPAHDAPACACRARSGWAQTSQLLGDRESQ
eukprot:scaffold1974_cov395-Prasinococcus_capsulatus_cf.AAC.4